MLKKVCFYVIFHCYPFWIFTAEVERMIWPFLYFLFIIVTVGSAIYAVFAHSFNRWSKSSYTVQTDVLLVPPDKGNRKKNGSGECESTLMDGQRNVRAGCQEPVVASKATIKSTATLRENFSTAYLHRRNTTGSRKIISKVTVLPLPPTNASSSWYCSSCSSQGAETPLIDAPRIFYNHCQRHNDRYSKYLSKN